MLTHTAHTSYTHTYIYLHVAAVGVGMCGTARKRPDWGAHLYSVYIVFII